MDSSQPVLARAEKVRLVLMDVDGVLTDGTFILLPGSDGRDLELKAFDSQDGIALQWLHRHGIPTGIISGRNSVSTAERARQAHMRYCYQGDLEKVPILLQIAKESGTDLSEMAYIGDDVTDIPPMRRVGFAVAVANARPEVKSVAHLVTTRSGGHGAVRDAVEFILKAKGLWALIQEKYEFSA